jgi:hypothetical protein
VFVAPWGSSTDYSVQTVRHDVTMQSLKLFASVWLVPLSLAVLHIAAHVGAPPPAPMHVAMHVSIAVHPGLAKHAWN